MAHVILFEKAQFRGAHKHVFGREPNLNADDDNFFNDRVSSLVVLEGNWKFFADSGASPTSKPYPPVVGPGLYRFLRVGIKNDDISSLQPVDDSPTVFGDPVTSHVILFEHASFHGAHRHVFVEEINLNAPEDSNFNDMVSSLSVLAGNWKFFADSGASPSSNPYPPVIGPPLENIPTPGIVGGIPFVGFVDIKNDDMSSLKAVDSDPTVRGVLMDHIVLFEHANFHGAHKHVLRDDNLDAPDDNFFDKKVSSLVVFSGFWHFNSGHNFSGVTYPAVRGPGLTSFVGDVGIPNDDMTSLAAT